MFINLNLPFNIKTKFDKSLKDYPEDKREFKKAIKFLEAKIKYDLSDSERSKILSQLGNLYRVDRNLNLSLQMLLEARVMLAGKKSSKSFFVNEIRLAYTLQLMKKFDEAEKIYAALEKRYKNSENRKMIDFLYQHRGKNFFDNGKLDEANVNILKALKLRLKKKNNELIESSVFALCVIGKKIKRENKLKSLRFR